MNSLSQFLSLSALSALTGLMVSCVSGPMDNSNSGMNGSNDVQLSQTEIYFDMYGGSAGIQIKSGVPLLLKNPVSSNEPEDYGQELLATYFLGNGKPMKCTSGIVDDVLLIHVEKSELRQSQCDTIALYDYSGARRASVTVKQAGNTTIGNDLGPGGRQVVEGCHRIMSNALSQILYTERCYTGIIENEDVRCPMTADNRYNTTAYGDAVSAILYIDNYIKQLASCGVREETPYYVFLKSVLYTEIANKWGNVPVFERVVSNDAKPVQLKAVEVLNYARAGLDSIAEYFVDKKSWGYTTDAATMYRPTRDVWRMAMSHISMGHGNYSEAGRLLQQIVDSRRYELTTDNGIGMNSETLWMIDIPDYPGADKLLPYYTYADALLLLAECKWHTGDAAGAKSIINEIASAKDMVISGDVVTDLELMRQYLCQAHYLSFQKRTGSGGYMEHEYLWPIPGAYLGEMTQNGGY